MDSVDGSPIDRLGTWDYVVFGASLLASLAIGLYYWLTGGRQRSNREYLLADGSMSVTVVSVSLMASFMSAITLLGVPAEVYSYGAIFFLINVSYIIGAPICAFFFLPVFFRLRCTSAYQYLELRFSKTVRRLASATFMLQMMVYMGIVLYAPALALSAVTGLSKWPAIAAVGIVCTAYCCFGGIKAVLWTDFLQSGLMFAALILVMVLGVREVGGIHEVFQRASNGRRLDFGNFDLDPTTRHSFFSLVIGGVFIYCSIYGVNQTQVQRLLTVSTLGRAQAALIISWPVTTLLSTCCVLTGIVMYAYFQDCDPVRSGLVKTQDQLLPLFMMRVMGHMPGLPGLFVAGIFSGALSSVSSFVNSLAAVTIEDFVKPCLLTWHLQLSAEKETLVTKMLAAGFGVVCLLVALMAEQMSGILTASLTIFGVVGGPLMGLFTLGMISKRCSTNAALTAFLLSLGLGFWIGFGAIHADVKATALPVHACPLTLGNSSANWTASSSSSDPHHVFYLYRLSYLYLAGLTFLVEVAAGLLLSVTLWPNTNASRLSDRLISPLFTCRSGHQGDDADGQDNGYGVGMDGEKGRKEDAPTEVTAGNKSRADGHEMEEQQSQPHDQLTRC